MEMANMRKMDTAREATIDLVALNDTVVNMRKVVKAGKVQIIHKLSRMILKLKNKKGTGQQKEKNLRKAQRMLDEIFAIKELNADSVTKFALANKATFANVCKEPSTTAKTRSLLRLAEHNLLSDQVKHFRAEHTDWEELATFLLSKQTGRRFKTKAQKERAAKKTTDTDVAIFQEEKSTKDNDNDESDERDSKDGDSNDDAVSDDKAVSEDDDSDEGKDDKRDSSEHVDSEAEREREEQSEDGHGITDDPFFISDHAAERGQDAAEETHAEKTHTETYSDFGRGRSHGGRIPWSSWGSSREGRPWSQTEDDRWLRGDGERIGRGRGWGRGDHQRGGREPFSSRGRGGYQRQGEGREPFSSRGRGGYQRQGEGRGAFSSRGRGGYQRQGEGREPFSSRGRGGYQRQGEGRGAFSSRGRGGSSQNQVSNRKDNPAFTRKTEGSTPRWTKPPSEKPAFQKTKPAFNETKSATKTDVLPSHPSWDAVRKRKLLEKEATFSGKHVKFDD
ncbi:hypothetical protein ACOMHN_018668 [Nucella lapillus]